ncbi:hypothetical protein GCM10014713_44360 [Streptomyces purpureus]|uniref:Uncharacterized protein n=1 Tax=Streptomyces purpureus TaxID=1951 RepID=A0A918LT57_9ACTN|nr:hypothetical protein GCM10014713_44360 [Streptomyces purpureus]
MKSLARDGDSDAGGDAGEAAGDSAAVSEGGSTGGEAASEVVGSASVGGCWLVLMTQTLRPATDSERNTIDSRPPRTA